MLAAAPVTPSIVSKLKGQKWDAPDALRRTRVPTQQMVRVRPLIYLGFPAATGLFRLPISGKAPLRREQVVRKLVRRRADMTQDVNDVPAENRGDRGCGYCASDENMFFGHVTQISSSERTQMLLLRST